MIIRSQDKKILTDNLNLEIVTHDVISTKFADFGEKKGEQSKIYNSVGLCMGIYSTEEKAIKVLDMIQKFYAATELTKLGRNIASSSVSEFEDMIFGCFDMPADEDVEV